MIWKEFYALACKLSPVFTQSLLYETSVACFTSAITLIKGEVNIHRALQSQVAGSLFFFAIARIFKENECRVRAIVVPLCGTTYRWSRVGASVRRANRSPLINGPASGEASTRPFAQLNLFYRKARMLHVDTGSIVAVKYFYF